MERRIFGLENEYGITFTLRGERRLSPDEVARYWPRGGAVFIAVRVLPNGRATDCKINRSIGVPAIDQWTCKLVEERAIFRPATDVSGRPVAAWYGYIQQESRRR